MTEPVRKSVTVPLPPEAAFDLFARIERWWPGTTPSPVLQFADPAPAGDALDTDTPRADTPEARRPVAVVSAWEPGRRLALHWVDGPGDETVVEIRFTASEGGTRVDLTHSERAGLTAANLAECCTRRRPRRARLCPPVRAAA